MEKNKINILIVDDSATMRMLLSVTIKKSVPGAGLSEAVNGVDALAKLQSRPFDLILTDMDMPEMDGAQLIRELRENLKSSIPVIIITTKGKENDVDLGMSLGANGYITKPINSLKLKEYITKFIG